MRWRGLRLWGGLLGFLWFSWNEAKKGEVMGSEKSGPVRGDCGCYGKKRRRCFRWRIDQLSL